MINTLPFIAILDDYQNAAFKYADWKPLKDKAVINAYFDHIVDEDELVSRLYEYEVICIMRERTPFQKSLLSRLPKLKLIVSTGTSNASLDIPACEDLGIQVSMTRYLANGAPELTWGLLMALSKNIVAENNALRSGSWQTSVGIELSGKTIGIIGLGNIGKKIAGYAKAFNMTIVAWSPNLTQSLAEQCGARLVSKEELLSTSDFVTIHLRLSDRSYGLISAADLSLLKSSAYLINTSRAKVLDQTALFEMLFLNKISGAALDVFDVEPIPPDSPFLSLPNLLATPHLGYVTEDNYKLFFEDTVSIIQRYLSSKNPSHQLK